MTYWQPRHKDELPSSAQAEKNKICLVFGCASVCGVAGGEEEVGRLEGQRARCAETGGREDTSGDGGQS